MDFQVQRVESAPIQPTGKQKKHTHPDGREFEQELEEAQPEAPVAPPAHEDTPIAPRLEGEAGGNLDLTA